MFSYNTITNKTILLRVDFNEPLVGDTLGSTRRIDASLTTIHELASRNNKIILISHHSERAQTMLPTYNYLNKALRGLGDSTVKYLNTINTETIKDYLDLTKDNISEIVLLENTRLFGEGLDENNDIYFAGFLASLAECFIFDAFSVGHRDHASTTGVAKILPSTFGPLFLKEMNALSRIIERLNNTLVFMGGSKLSTKLPIIELLLNGGSTVCLGGAMLHPILNLEGLDIKQSYTEAGFTFDKNIITNQNLILANKQVWNNENTKIVDSEFDFELIDRLITAKNIQNMLWNGPVGLFEEGYTRGSDLIYDFITNHKICFTVTGGGDTITYLEEKGGSAMENFSYVSLSGGAMLEFLAMKSLPIQKYIN